MSGSKTRYLYNNICELKCPGRKTKYLEVGTWKGSSFVSAVYGNDHLEPLCIDNWSEFGGPREEFFHNCKTFLPSLSANSIIENDCFEVTTQQLGEAPIDIYMYDGGHREEEHRSAITYMYQFLAKPCIVIVDDWNWEAVKKGTASGLEAVGAEVFYACDAGAGVNDDHGGFWNGAGLFVVG